MGESTKIGYGPMDLRPKVGDVTRIPIPKTASPTRDKGVLIRPEADELSPARTESGPKLTRLVRSRPTTSTVQSDLNWTT